jgi:hypothetical protein
MRTPLDMHGQPLNPAVNRRRRTERDLSELLGVTKGMLCDGIISDDEALFLAKWGVNHPDALDQWPTSLIFTRLNQFFADGRIDDVERIELQELLGALVGGTASLLLGYEGATTLPLDAPPPELSWTPTDVYVFTGRFAFGPRRDCERVVCERGAQCESNVTRRTSFMVVGPFGSVDWKHSSYGTKIQKAVDLRGGGLPLRIVGEDHWASAIA